MKTLVATASELLQAVGFKPRRARGMMWPTLYWHDGADRRVFSVAVNSSYPRTFRIHIDHYRVPLPSRSRWELNEFVPTRPKSEQTLLPHEVTRELIAWALGVNINQGPPVFPYPLSTPADGWGYAWSRDAWVTYEAARPTRKVAAK